MVLSVFFSLAETSFMAVNRLRLKYQAEAGDKKAETIKEMKQKYDIDIDLTRGFPAEVCKRWCVLPFDRMSKSVLVATANPFNQQAVKELSETTSHRLVWYLVPPADLLLNLRKAFR